MVWMVVLIVLVSFLAVGWLALIQALFIAEKLFSTIEEKYYMKQCIPVIGIFYSFYLRRKFGFRKGCVWGEIEGAGYFYNLETHEAARGGIGAVEKSLEDGDLYE
jgi:hypothetical protein